MLLAHRADSEACNSVSMREPPGTSINPARHVTFGERAHFYRSVAIFNGPSSFSKFAGEVATFEWLSAAHHIFAQASQQASTVIRSASTAAASNQLVGAYHGKLGEVFHPTFVGNKLSIIFTLGDGPGSLQSVLGLFSKHGINMSRIESKPTKGLR